MDIRLINTVKFALYFAVFLNIVFWFYGRDIRGHWQAVPPVPSTLSLEFSSIGDSQLAYRLSGMMLQNFGDSGGRSTPLSDYDFEDLSKWLYVVTDLDPTSSFVPYLGAMYFGNVQDISKLPPLLEYLSVVGKKPGVENWRWLAHAAYLSRFKMKDLDLALQYARELAALPGDLPVWTRQMPGFILNAKGNNDEALAVMVEILRSGVDTLHPNEINHTRSVICERLLSTQEASAHPLCQNK